MPWNAHGYYIRFSTGQAVGWLNGASGCLQPDKGDAPLPDLPAADSAASACQLLARPLAACLRGPPALRLLPGSAPVAQPR